MDRAKQIWEDLGEKDAYFAVAAYEEFREGNLDDEAKEKFFQTGKDHVEELWREIERNFEITFTPGRSLDYGCGVGRVLMPLTEKSDSVVGVDISRAMLNEAGKNCSERDLQNVELRDSAEFMNAESEKYDFVHSFIVLQHIAPKLGNEIIRKMAERLTTGGVGMVHVTFFDKTPTFRGFRAKVYRDVPFVHRFISVIRGKDGRFMPMHEYDLNAVFQILNENGCNDLFVRFSDHGFLGVMIFFRKAETSTENYQRMHE